MIMFDIVQPITSGFLGVPTVIVSVFSLAVLDACRKITAPDNPLQPNRLPTI